MPEDLPPQESALKRRREELGLTQRDVAAAVNVSVQTVSNWETGRYKDAKLTLPQVKALCTTLRWSIEELPDELGPSLS
jgi:DNA-binding XRE family transcriptional regulator